MKKILLVFGTRPEAIKMAPLVKQFYKFPEEFISKVCVTAQHREMLDQVIDFFDILPDYDLNLMVENQTLSTLTANITTKIEIVLDEFKPDYVFVHGDTTTSMVTALTAFYKNIKICHVEAGLRTYDKLSPFPEEINRQIISKIADIHFAPTENARKNLEKEGIEKDTILVTGNTVIDALLSTVEVLKSDHNYKEIIELKSLLSDSDDPIILVTGHRRENFGKGFENICDALSIIANRNKVRVVYPVHLNPNVKNIVNQRLGDIPNVKLIPPLSYPAFAWLMNQSKIIITDSGGIQEEAPSLKKPVLVTREKTEREEAVEAGVVKLVGTNSEEIVRTLETLLSDTSEYQKMTGANNPYGNGNSSFLIVEFLKKLK